MTDPIGRRLTGRFPGTRGGAGSGPRVWPSRLKPLLQGAFWLGGLRARAVALGSGPRVWPSRLKPLLQGAFWLGGLRARAVAPGSGPRVWPSRLKPLLQGALLAWWFAGTRGGAGERATGVAFAAEAAPTGGSFWPGGLRARAVALGSGPRVWPSRLKPLLQGGFWLGGFRARAVAPGSGATGVAFAAEAAPTGGPSGRVVCGHARWRWGAGHGCGLRG